MADFSTGAGNVQNEPQTCCKQEKHQTFLALCQKDSEKIRITPSGLRWDHMSTNKDMSYNQFKYF